MKTVHFPNLDLNLLRVFQTLMEEQNVTRAGERLGLTQSAVSHALNRLRAALGDELFVRTADGMRPTPWAIDAGPRIELALSQLQRALAPTDFDPAQTERRFVLGLTPYTSILLAPGLAQTFRQRAPRADLVLRQQERSVAEALDGGRLDVAVGVFGRSPERYERRTLFEERLVWVMRRDHPRAGEPLTIRTLMEVPHLIVSNADNLADGDPIMNDHGLQRRLIWDDGGAYLRAVGQTGAPRPRIMTTPDSVTLLAIVARSDMAALAPLRMAKFFREPFGLTLFDPPYEAPPMGVDVIWRRDHGAHPAVQWLIDLMIEEAGRIG